MNLKLSVNVVLTVVASLTLLLLSTSKAFAVTTPTSAPVYRFRNEVLKSAHFYTISTTQKETVINNSKPGGKWANMFYLEGEAFGAYPAEGETCPVGEPVYRFRNERFGSAHFYTINPTQYQEVINNSRIGGIWAGMFVSEGIAFCAFSGQAVGTSPVHRFRNESLGGSVHFYTIVPSQYDTVLNNSKPGGIWAGVFKYEGIAFYAYEIADAEFNKFYNVPNLSLKFLYDSNATEVDSSTTSQSSDSCIQTGTTYKFGQVSFTNGVVVNYSECILGAGGSEDVDEPTYYELFEVRTEGGPVMYFSAITEGDLIILSGGTTFQRGSISDMVSIYIETDLENYELDKEIVSKIAKSVEWRK